MSNDSRAAGQEMPPSSPGRLVSLDALRGFDMFWIIGGDVLVGALRKTSDQPAIKLLADQMEHVQWGGFHFYDLIFPMFIFIVGVSLVYSLEKTIEQHGRFQATTRIFRRALLMYLLGIFYYGGFSTPLAQIRLLGVLQRIALCYFFAGLIFCYFNQAGRIIWCLGLLVGYWLLMTFVPVPGGAAGNFAEGQNLSDWIDKMYLPLRKWDGDHDPEGLLSTLPAIATCLIGVFTGVFLRDARGSNATKVICLVIAGAALVALGWTWSLQFPVIKKIWTSSYVLVAGGYSLLFLAFFYTVIDTLGWQTWAQPFVWIGMNPITIYMIDNLEIMEKIAQRLVGGELNTKLGSLGPMVLAVTQLLLFFAVARFLYVRRIFLRL